MRAALTILAMMAAGAASCTINGDDTQQPPIDMSQYVDQCTPEFAGFGGAPEVEYSHYAPPARCVLDAEGLLGTCDISGCSVPDLQRIFTAEDQIAPYLDCETGAPVPSGIDFNRELVLFVRQGMRIGEWMRPNPIIWVVNSEGRIIVAEKRGALCGSDQSGGVVSYAVLLAADTSTAAIERHVYRNPYGCQECADGDCGE